MNRIDSLEKLEIKLAENNIRLTAQQLEWFRVTSEENRPNLPFLTTGEYLDAALSADKEGRKAVLKQIIPDVREFDVKDYELEDPLGEQKYSPLARFVHRYPDRSIILVTDSCAMFCRHCFRRSFSGGKTGSITDSQLKQITGYLSGHEEIKELLLTGGDPLTLTAGRLKTIIKEVKAVRPELIVRICSRIPVVAPDRITVELAAMLSSFSGIWFITHFNHSAELTDRSKAALQRLVKAGIPVLNQTVLLRGVNDRLETLADLFQNLLINGVKPYYLFQGDLAAGTSHLRVPLDEALLLTAELKYKISGMAMPRFAVDLPGGGGKITLPSQSHPIVKSDDYYIIKGLDNEEYRYPAN